jgi:hypothetical protein
LDLAALALLVGLAALFPDFYPSPQALAEGEHEYVATHLWPIARTALQFILISNGLAFAFGHNAARLRRLTGQGQSGRRATPQDVWSTFMVDLPPRDCRVSVAVLRDDQAVLSGTLAAVEVYDGEPILVLRDGKYIAHPGQPPRRLDDNWHFLIVNSSAVKSVALSYVSADESDR